MRKLLGWGLALSLLAACTSGSTSSRTSRPPPGCPAVADATACPSPLNIDLNASLKVQLLSDVNYTFDPQQEYYQVTWELYRCCLLRTLMSYKGMPTAEGGTRVFPDLAAGPPQVSLDGLTWTFKVRPGIHYSPPLQDVTVTANDFVRAIDREACATCSANGYSQYYTVIRGFSDVYSGKNTTGVVSGVRALDDSTLQIHLTEPAGDLPFRFAMPATAPIPALPRDPSALLGIATGHDQNDGRYALVGTGPYMIEGTDRLNLGGAPKKVQPVSGYTPGKVFVFVHNPSWDPATDPLRHRNVKEMDFTVGGTVEDAAHKVDTGQADICMDCPPIPDQLQRYLDTHRRDRVQIHPDDTLRYIAMNVAQPPFDDVHVRRALIYAIDREGMRELRGGPLVGQSAHHIFPDSVENGALRNFDPYQSPRDTGSSRLAKEEMARSRYDTNHDGVCDKPACDKVLTFIDEIGPYPAQAALIQRDLEPLGITLVVRACVRGCPYYPNCLDPAQHAAFCPSVAWSKDYPDAFTYGPPLFSAASIGLAGCCNYGLVGASARLLRKDGYNTTSVPSVDPQMKRCERLVGDARVTCWTDLDRFLMEKVVPVIPYLFDNTVNVLGKRVACYSYDQFAAEVALDHLCLTS